MSSANTADGACRDDPPHYITFGLPEDPATGSLKWDYGSIDLSGLRERSRFYAEKAGASAHLIGKHNLNLHACMQNGTIGMHLIICIKLTAQSECRII